MDTGIKGRGGGDDKKLAVKRIWKKAYMNIQSLQSNQQLDVYGVQ